MTADVAKPCLVRIVHMGDSVTFGQHIDPDLRWTSLIAHQLDEVYRQTLVHLLCLNKGVSGETTRMGLERFPTDVQDCDPDIVTIQYGLNDCNCWLSDRGLPRVSDMAFRANLVEMVVRAKHFGARHIVLANNHRTLRSKVMLSGERYEDANARYSEIAWKVSLETGITFCDIRKAFQPYTEEELDHRLLPYPDHVHLSVEGNRVYAETIWPLIRTAVEDVIQANLEIEGKRIP